MVEAFAGFEGNERIYPGHNACPGCGAALAVRHLTRALGEKQILVITASCWSIIAGAAPITSLNIPVLHSPFACAATVGSGIKRGLQLKGDDETVVAVLAGDGGTFDIGLQSLSAAAQRNEDIIFICYDNEAYMNTGIQTSSATPFGAHTTTLPFPRYKDRRKKDIMAIMAAHRIPYAATATVAFPEDLIGKFQLAAKIKGFRFFHLLTPCPAGWGAEPELTIHLSRMAVESCLFPLYQVRDGEVFEISYQPLQKKGLEEYLRLQRRYSGLERWQVEALQQELLREWEKLLVKAEGSCY